MQERIAYRKEVADEIIKLMSKGNSEKEIIIDRPFNAITKRPFHACNALYLSLKQINSILPEDSRWYPQSSGFKVKKNEQPTKIEFWIRENPHNGNNISVVYQELFHASQLQEPPPFISKNKTYKESLNVLKKWHQSDLDIRHIFNSSDNLQKQVRQEISNLYTYMDLGLPFKPTAALAEKIKNLPTPDALYHATKDAEKLNDYFLSFHNKNNHLVTNIITFNNLSPEQIVEILDFNMPKTQTIKPLLTQEYSALLKEHILQKIQENNSYTDDIDFSIADKLIEKGYTKFKISEVINKKSPFNSAKTQNYSIHILNKLSTNKKIKKGI